MDQSISNCIGSEGNTHGQTDIYYIPPSRLIAGGIKICAYQILLIPEFFLEGGDLVFFFYMKKDQGKKVLLQVM